jgi:hypothetical protein
MTEPDYKQILKNQDTISQLSLEDVKTLQGLLFKREYELKAKPPERHILDDPENIKASIKKFVDENLIPRVEYIISVNQEAVTDHKVLWRQYYIDNNYKSQESVDEYMNTLIWGWMVEELHNCFNGVEND